jgi:tetratricopeptide (TPR) repeat protein
MAVERFTTPLPAVSAVAPPAGLVGRDAEVAQVHAVLERARGGQRQVLFVSGEAGIGKTTLIEACVAGRNIQPAEMVAWGQCVEAYGPSIGYLPVLEALGRLCRGPDGATVIDCLRQWAPTWLVQIAGVVPPVDYERLQRHTQGVTRDRHLRELAEVLEVLTATRLLVLVLEDLHWSDASTVDVLTILARRREAARLVVLGTYRPVELILRTHPLKQAVIELQLHGQCAELPLRYLQPQAVDAYVAQRFPVCMARAIGPMVYHRTAGHPLFMVHLAEYLVQQVGLDSSVAEATATLTAMADVIPVGVRQLIELQLEQLHGDEQRVLEMASVAGVECAGASVAAGLQMPLARLETICARLSQRGLFLEACGLAAWPDGTLSGQYRFRHALYQQVLYRRLTEMQQMQGHRRIGERLEAGYGARAGEQAATLAMHFVAGRDYPRAVRYLQQAAENAAYRCAPREAIELLTKGLELLATLPPSAWHVQTELQCQAALGTALLATHGYTSPMVAQAYHRVQSLSQQVPNTPEVFQALWGLYQFHSVRGEHQQARLLAEHLLALAHHTHDPTCLVVGYYAVGVGGYYLGEFAASCDRLGQAQACYERHQHRAHIARYGVDVGVICGSFMPWPLWFLGYPDRALRLSQEALTLAEALAHPYSVAIALARLSQVHQLRREAQAAHACAETLITLATAQGFTHYVILGRGLQDWALAVQSGVPLHLEQFRQIYGWFTEGFDTLDLQEAKTLLAALE